MITTARPSSGRSRSSRRSTRLRLDTSRALTGSSQKSSRGRVTMARASETRCRWPPESWRGWRSRNESASRPTRASASDDPLALGREAAGDVERLGDQLADGEVGVERAQRVLEGQLHLAGAAERPQRAALQRAEVGALEVDAAAGRADQADGGAGQRGLARAGLADDAEDLPRPDVEVDVGQRGPGAQGAGAARWRVRDRQVGDRRSGAVLMSGLRRSRGPRRGRSAPTGSSGDGSARPARRCSRPRRRGSAARTGSRASPRRPPAGWPGITSSVRRLQSPMDATASSARV